jgi:hypothetical protein
MRPTILSGAVPTVDRLGARLVYVRADTSSAGSANGFAGFWARRSRVNGRYRGSEQAGRGNTQRRADPAQGEKGLDYGSPMKDAIAAVRAALWSEYCGAMTVNFYSALDSRRSCIECDLELNYRMPGAVLTPIPPAALRLDQRPSPGAREDSWPPGRP